MKPEEARNLFYQTKYDEYHRQRQANIPVNDKLCELAAFQAIIESVTKQVDLDWSERYLAMQQLAAKFTD